MCLESAIFLMADSTGFSKNACQPMKLPYFLHIIITSVNCFLMSLWCQLLQVFVNTASCSFSKLWSHFESNRWWGRLWIRGWLPGDDKEIPWHVLEFSLRSNQKRGVSKYGPSWLNKSAMMPMKACMRVFMAPKNPLYDTKPVSCHPPSLTSCSVLILAPATEEVPFTGLVGFVGVDGQRNAFVNQENIPAGCATSGSSKQP